MFDKCAAYTQHVYITSLSMRCAVLQVYQTVLSPDELFAEGHLPVRVVDAAPDAVPRGKGRGSKAAGVSKEQLQRQEKLAAEVCIRSCVVGYAACILYALMCTRSCY